MRLEERLLGREESVSSRVLGTVVNFLLVLLIAVLLVVLIVTCAFALCQVDGTSMTPTLEDRQYVMVEKYKSTIARGEIVVFRKQGSDRQLIKRAVAVAGDTFMFTCEGNDVTLYVGGVVSDDFGMSTYPWTRFPREMMFEFNVEYTVPEGTLFVLGDNRNDSKDSRFADVGFVDCATELVGRADIFVTPGSFTEWLVKLIYGVPFGNGAETENQA